MSREFSRPPASGRRGRIADCGTPPSPRRPPCSRPATSWRSPPRRSTGSPPTRPTARPWRGSTRRRAGPFNPLIAHVDSSRRRWRMATSGAGRSSCRGFLAGPLTLVVPALAASPISDLARAGLDSVALRVPAHPAARALLLAAFGRPLAAPSPTCRDASAHHSRRRGGGTGGARGDDPRRRRLPRGARIDDRRQPRRTPPAAAARRRHARRDRAGAGASARRTRGRWRPARPACWRATTPRARSSAWRPSTSRPTRRCSPSAGAATAAIPPGAT